MKPACVSPSAFGSERLLATVRSPTPFALRYRRAVSPAPFGLSLSKPLARGRRLRYLSPNGDAQALRYLRANGERTVVNVRNGLKAPAVFARRQPRDAHWSN